LVALGITYPEGSEMWGRADPALMLITNIFIRPVFMIFGLVSGIILSYVAVRFINFSFASVIGMTTGGGDAGGTFHYIPFAGNAHTLGPLQLILYVIIYVGLIVAILNKCFSLITIIPDKVLRWIGGQQGQFGEGDHGEEKVKEAFSGGAHKISQGGDAAGKALQGKAEKQGKKIGARKQALRQAKEHKESDEAGQGNLSANIGEGHGGGNAPAPGGGDEEEEP
jgi:defect-in-organelle-trafficking protein DotA